MTERIPVRVLFRADGYGVTAVLDIRDEAPWLSVYAHEGQHSTGSIDWMRTTRPATPEEYASLLRELTAIGYDVTIGRRLVNFYKRK